MSDGKIAAAAAKPDLSILPVRSRVGVARIRAYGAKKYTPGNYLKATLADGAGARYVAGMLRHLQAMQAPGGLFTNESLAALDDESGLPHIDHMLCGLEMLREILIQEDVLPEDPGIGKEPSTQKEPPTQVVKLDAETVPYDVKMRALSRPKKYIVRDYKDEPFIHADVSWFTTEQAALNYAISCSKGYGFVTTSRDPDTNWGVVQE